MAYTTANAPEPSRADSQVADRLVLERLGVIEPKLGRHKYR